MGWPGPRWTTCWLRTGTSKGQLFHYFPGGREDLLLAVADYEAGRVLADQQPYLGQLTSSGGLAGLARRGAAALPSRARMPARHADHRTGPAFPRGPGRDRQADRPVAGRGAGRHHRHAAVRPGRAGAGRGSHRGGDHRGHPGRGHHLDVHREQHAPGGGAGHRAALPPRRHGVTRGRDGQPVRLKNRRWPGAPRSTRSASRRPAPPQARPARPARGPGRSPGPCSA